MEPCKWMPSAGVTLWGQDAGCRCGAACQDQPSQSHARGFKPAVEPQAASRKAAGSAQLQAARQLTDPLELRDTYRRQHPRQGRCQSPLQHMPGAAGVPVLNWSILPTALPLGNRLDGHLLTQWEVVPPEESDEGAGRHAW